MDTIKKQSNKEKIMSDKINVSSLRPISDIKRVYSGKPGCACGCQGTYYPKRYYAVTPSNGDAVTPSNGDAVTPSNGEPSKKDMNMFKRVQKIFQENLPNVYTWESHKDQFIALDTSETRTYTIYYQ